MSVIARVRHRGRPSLAPAPARGRARPRGGGRAPRRAQRRRRDRRDPLDRARARRSAALRMWALRRRARRARRRPAAVRRDDLQGRRRRARPRRRQGRDPRPGGNGALEPSVREAMLLDFADLVESLDGRYITAEDVGTGTDDMTTIARASRSTSPGCRPRTAAAAIRARSPRWASRPRSAPASRYRRGAPELDGLRIVVVGLGHVGSRLAARLRRGGREADRRRRRSRQARARRPPRRALGRARCGDANALRRARAVRARRRRSTSRRSDSLGAGIVCGAANNQLTDERLADRAGRARGHLRARLHRQRRRADQRLPRAPRARRGLGARARRAGSRRRWRGSSPWPRTAGSCRWPPRTSSRASGSSTPPCETREAWLSYA